MTDEKPLWPIRPLVGLSLAAAILSLIVAPVLATSRNAFTEPFAIGMFVLLWVRLAVARMRKETGRGWMVYVALLIAVPLVAYLYAENFIPMVAAVPR